LTPQKINHVINNLEKIRNELKVSRNIVDGLGSKRIAKEISRL